VQKQRGNDAHGLIQSNTISQKHIQISALRNTDLNLSERHNTSSREYRLNYSWLLSGRGDAFFRLSEKLTYRMPLYQSVLFISLENNVTERMRCRLPKLLLPQVTRKRELFAN
jgi:hypothetical protein